MGQMAMFFALLTERFQKFKILLYEGFDPTGKQSRKTISWDGHPEPNLRLVPFMEQGVAQILFLCATMGNKNHSCLRRDVRYPYSTSEDRFYSNAPQQPPRNGKVLHANTLNPDTFSWHHTPEKVQKAELRHHLPLRF